MSYADIVDALLVASNRKPGTKLAAAKERSFRRALQSLVNSGVLIALDDNKRSIRYSLHPADIPTDSNWTTALNGNYEAAMALAISVIKHTKPNGKVPPNADATALAVQILIAAMQSLSEEQQSAKSQPQIFSPI
jgi:hypothetical protein